MKDRLFHLREFIDKNGKRHSIYARILEELREKEK